VPAPESFPLHDLVAAAQAAIERHGALLMQYGPSRGFQPLREWLAAWKGVPPGCVLTGNGSLQLIDLLFQRLLDAGDVAFTEAPSYDRTLTLLRRHRARVVGIPLEADGPRLDALEAALDEARPRLFYAIPDFQNPSGVTWSLAKRTRVAELARRHGFWLLEDAPYRPLRYRGQELPTLFDLEPERTLHLLSFSKLVGPGGRVGILYGPERLLDEVAKLAEDTYITPALLAHGIVHEFCARGLLPAQVERLRALYAPRLDACLAALARHLPEAQPTRPEGGFFLSLTLPDETSPELRRRAAAFGLELSDGNGFFADGRGGRFVRLPYCALTPEEIDEGVRRLAAAAREVANETLAHKIV
jgi:DNA-binding transcriptional MocR family regulator